MTKPRPTEPHVTLSPAQCKAQAWLDMVWRGEYNTADRDSLANAFDSFADTLRTELTEARARIVELEDLAVVNGSGITLLGTQLEEARRERDALISEPPPELIERWMQNELSDYAMVLDHCSRVYCHFTRGRISKPNTFPDEVIREAEELIHADIDEAVNEAVAELTEARARLAALPSRPAFFESALSTERYLRGTIAWLQHIEERDVQLMCEIISAAVCGPPEGKPAPEGGDADSARISDRDSRHDITGSGRGPAPGTEAP